MTKAVLFALAVLAVGTAMGGLVKETNTYNGMTNVALGGTPFAPDSINGYPIHVVAGLNDGVYGNSNSWIQGQSSPYGTFAGVKLAGPKTIGGVAFGRDNTGAYGDRANGVFTVQYTMHPSPETLSLPTTGNPATGWAVIGTVTETDPKRKRYAVTPPVSATGLRLVLSSEQLCIDEFEILETTTPAPPTPVPPTPVPPTHDPAVAAFCDDIASKCSALDAECTTIRNGHGPVVGAGTMPNTAGNGGVGHATGNVVLSGNSVVVTATGIISCSGTSCPNTPDGSTTPAHGSMVLPGVNQHSLIARIGAGPWQFIGAGPTTLTGNGALTFAFNDGLGSYGDNTGSWFITIRDDITNVADDCDASVAVCNDMVVDCQEKAASCPLV